MKKVLSIALPIFLATIFILSGCTSPALSPSPEPLPQPSPEIMPAPAPVPEPVPGGQQRGGQQRGGASAPAAEPKFVPTPGWDTRSPLLEPNSEFAVAELDSKIYVIGGYPYTRETVTTVQVYDSRQDRWEYATPLPQPINHGMAAAVNGKVYMIGGQTHAGGSPERAGFLDTVFEYNPELSTWTPRAPMPTARGGGATAVIDNKIYIAGGGPPQGNDFAVYEPDADRWTTLPDLPTQRNHLVVAAIDGKVYVVGGRFGAGFSSELTNVLEIFDPATNTWKSGAPMPTTRSGINGIVANGCLHVWGGEGNDDSPLGVFGEHEVYNPVSDRWISLAPLPVPVHGVTGAAFIDGWIHLPGGGISLGGSSGVTIHQVFRPETSCN
jgi:N-acetylneuraminic acid mutarotase